MRHHTRQCPAGAEHNSVSARASTGVDLVGAENWKLLVRTRHVEVDALVVVLGVWVVVAADLFAFRVVHVALVDGLVDVRLVIADRAAGVRAGSFLVNGFKRFDGMGQGEGWDQGQEGQSDA